MQKNVDKTLQLYNGISIPSIGFGTWQIPPFSTAKCVRNAVKAGYGNFDTAEGYMNEKGLGDGLRQAMEETGVKREELFVSTKVWNSHRGYDKTMQAFEAPMKKLGLEYLDLYLIHWPAVSRWHDDWRQINRSTWRAFEQLYREGRIKAIGVSNFLAHHVQALTEDSEIKPMVNQIEYHPGFGQAESAAYCQQNGIVVEAWSPLGSGDVLRNQELNRVAAKHGKTPAQVSLRWLMQKGIVPLPKSTHKARMVENISVFDFSLDDEDMTVIDAIPYCGGMMFDPDNARS